MLAQWLDYRLDNTGFELWVGWEIFLSSKSYRLAMGPTQFPIQWVLWIFPRGKVAGHDVDHSLHLVPNLRMSGAILPLPHMPSWHGHRQLHLHFMLIFITWLNETFCNFMHMTAILLHHRCTVWWNSLVFPSWMYSGFPHTTWTWQIFNHYINPQ